jgi:spermidine synthase
MTISEKPGKIDSIKWFTDCDTNFALSIRLKGERLFHEVSPFQTVEIFDTCDRGKMLAIDNIVMCTEADEATYHEMIAHVPMLTNPGIKDVLVIGAGDGGTIRELVRHQGIERITMVEIDEVVVRASKQFLPTMSCALEHPKLNLLIDDGITFVKNADYNSYDLIVIDSSDPIGPSKGLFTKSFYENVYRALRPGGVVTVQSESPISYQEAFVDLNQCLKQFFGNDSVHCYLAFIPMYPTGMWSFTYCSKQGNHPVDNLDCEKAAQFAKQHNLRYYNADIHKAAFALPGFIQEMIEE